MIQSKKLLWTIFAIGSVIILAASFFYIMQKRKTISKAYNCKDEQALKNYMAESATRDQDIFIYGTVTTSDPVFLYAAMPNEKECVYFSVTEESKRYRRKRAFAKWNIKSTVNKKSPSFLINNYEISDYTMDGNYLLEDIKNNSEYSRTVYHYLPNNCTGTLYAHVSNGKISGEMTFFPYKDITAARKELGTMSPLLFALGLILIWGLGTVVYTRRYCY